MGTWGDSLGLAVGDLTDTHAAAEAAEVGRDTFAAIAAVHRETTTGWILFIAAWTTGLGYGVATFFYQAAIFTRDALSSATWIGIMVALFAAVLLTMRR